MHAGEAALEQLCARLRVPQECRDLAVLAARHCRDIRNANELAIDALLSLMQITDALRRPDRFDQLLEVCAAAAGEGTGGAPFRRLRQALAAAKSVDAGAVAKGCNDAADIKERVAEARIAAIKSALSAK
jgi:tRNA nucleotidyltransferase (CCA-adding enzyme)